MKNKTQSDSLVYVIIGLLIGGAAVWFLTTSAVNSNNAYVLRMMGVGNNFTNMIQSVDNIDAYFIEQMIPHHEDAITMSELAQKKAQRPEVKQLAQNIIESQGKEIDQMKRWYKDWFWKNVPEDEGVMGQHGMMGTGTMHMGMMGDEEDLIRLKEAKDFDEAFVKEMIPHHQMAVMMASMLRNGTNRPEMKKLANDIINTQTNEIDQMREWLKEW